MCGKYSNSYPRQPVDASKWHVGYNMNMGMGRLKSGANYPNRTETHRGRQNIVRTATDQETLTYFSVRELERVLVFT